MSKEITPLKALASLRCAVSLGLGTQYEEMNNKCDIIETALERLVELEDIFSEIKSGEAVVVSAEKSKAIEIIKNKKVDMTELLGYFEWENGFSFYNEYLCEEEKLTQEEYDLLKEVLL